MKKRNYLPRGKDPKMNIYHDSIDRLLLNSQVLNGAGKTPTVHSVIYDEGNIKSELFQLVGDQNGRSTWDGLTHFASLPFVDMRLEEVEGKFKKYCKLQVSQGHSKPTDWPKYLLDERLKLEAQKYVLLEEVEELQRRLSIIAEKNKEKSDLDVLKSGTVGQSQIKDDKLVSIDGMSVKEIDVDPKDKNSEKVLIIDCDHPKAKFYDGYSVADYYQFIVEPWKSACEKQSVINKIQAKKDNVKLDQLSRGLRNGANAKVPTMPQECRNYKEVKVLERSK